MSEKKPFEIARETLKQLTTRKLVPTPANYKSIYNEIAGIPSMEQFPAQELRADNRCIPAVAKTSPKTLLANILAGE